MRRLALVLLVVGIAILWRPFIRPIGAGAILVADIYSSALWDRNVAAYVTPLPVVTGTRETFAGMEMRVTWWRPSWGDRHPALMMVNGATALGLAGEVGALASGMKADVVLLDADAPNLRPIIDGFSILVHAGVGANVRGVIVDGRVLMDDGRPTRFDADEVIAAAQDVATRLWAESGWSPVLARARA